MITRRVFALIDALLILAAFVVTHAVTPLLWSTRNTVAAYLLEVIPSYAQYFRPGPDIIPPLSQVVWILLVIAPVVVVVLLAIDAYEGLHESSRTRTLLAGPFAAVIGMGVAALVIFLVRTPALSRVYLFTFTVLMAAALTSVRVFIRTYQNWQARSGYYRRNILVVGSKDAMPSIVEAIRPVHWPVGNIDVIGYVDSVSPAHLQHHDPDLKYSRPATTGRHAASTVAFVEPSATGEPAAADPHCLGSVADMQEILLHHPVHEVVAVIQGDGDTSWIPEVIRACDHAGISFRLVPDVLLGRSVANLVVAEHSVGLGRGVPSIALVPRVFNPDALRVKRIIDVTLASTALLLFAPLFGLIALLVRFSSPGPIFHPSSLVGQNGKRFVAWKFRTMVANANDLKPTLSALNEMTGPVFKIRDDPRVTQLGRWLRKYSLDELPQLYSVVKGDQSLVGPRAASAHEFERYEFWQMRKISVKPGITCFWQVRGRNRISNFDEWIRMDLEYIDNWSLWLDFKILVRTVLVVVQGTGY